jgi:hypothetical protein
MNFTENIHQGNGSFFKGISLSDYMKDMDDR